MSITGLRERRNGLNLFELDFASAESMIITMMTRGSDLKESSREFEIDDLDVAAS